ncbi:reticulon-like protein B11 [Salvia miltiorrhiza]|uniref:reticulon-like protein B11 n=1 Tax=Salvia miltiorrhiza TaxID=226208 RepID=UPI0025AD8E7C|nr:reticulon-like protein B11 [Salvia miltiorrhiza]
MGEPHRFSDYLVLGDGPVADILLWKKPNQSILILVLSTLLWLLFEKGGYNLLSFISNVLFFLVIILFFWAKSAALLNRPLPPLPNLEVSEEVAVKVADEMRVCINHVLSMAHDIAIGGDLKLFWQLALGFWFISYIGSLFNFLTLVYIGVLLCFSLPLLYDKHQALIDDKLYVVQRIVQMQYRLIDEHVLGKTPST